MIKLFKNWIHYLFPKRCAVCETPINFREKICTECESKLNPITEKVCLRCGHILKNCECKRFAYHFRGVAVPFENSGAAREGIYTFKIHKNFDAADYFGEQIAKRVRELFPDVEFDIVTAIPMYERKSSLEIFDHAEFLAESTARHLGVRYKQLLLKSKKNKSQHTLDAKERFINVKNAYEAIGKITYKNILLVDDIKTTGATLDECSRKLMLAGAENVYCATALITTCKEQNSKL